MSKVRSPAKPADSSRSVHSTGTGYSGTPLGKKLGVKDGHRVALFGAPIGFERTLDGLGEDVTIVRDPARRGTGPFDVIVSFHDSQTSFGAAFASRAAALSPTGGLWFAWPKKASGVKTDLTETVIRDAALAAGLVDNKVCAIDSVWSGLRIVVRVKDRPKTDAVRPARARQQPPK